eukprot:gene7648-803_t
MVLSTIPADIDLLFPPKELEQRRHKLKRLVQSPNSFFMDVGCFNITTVFSHSQTVVLWGMLSRGMGGTLFVQGCLNISTSFSRSETVVLCGSCSSVLCTPTGGKARLTEGTSFRKKSE